MRSGSATSLRLRRATTRDLDWVVRRHAELYARDYGYNRDFEATVAAIVRLYRRRRDTVHERGWIALHRGRPAGCVFVTRRTRLTGQLRLLLVEPSARGLGIGSRLVDEVIQFARRVGYRKIVLWTQRELTSARRIYKAAGFRLVSEEDHEMFGMPLRAETWELAL